MSRTTRRTWPSISLCSDPALSSESTWSRGITRMCVGACGERSLNATHTSSSNTRVDGISPAAILQKIQSANFISDSQLNHTLKPFLSCNFFLRQIVGDAFNISPERTELSHDRL